MARREHEALLSTQSWSRVNNGNQEEAARQAELSGCEDRVGEQKRDGLWWWLAAADSSPEGSNDPSLESEELPHVTQDDALGGNQREKGGEEEQVLELKDAGTREPMTVAFESLFAGLLDEAPSESESDQSSGQQQRRRQQQSSSDADSWEPSQSTGSSIVDGEDGSSSSGVSSLSSQSPGSDPGSCPSTGSVYWAGRETEDKNQSQDEAVLPRLEESDFAFGGVDMMALWLGSDPPASDSGESEQSSGYHSSSATGGGGGEDSSDQMSSVSRSASVEDLASASSSIDALSSLSSFSVQSGVCAISSPRRIENIPVVPAVTTNAKGRNGDDSLSTAYRRCWSYHDFVRPEAPLSEWDPEPRRRLLKPEHDDTILTLKKRLGNPHKLTNVTTRTQHSQFVTPDAELFVRFSELHGIIADHMPRRHDYFLDVGCGTSGVCREMVLHGYNRLYGIDIAPAKLEFQREQCLGLDQFVRFQEMDASELKFPDQLFDCIFTKATLDIVASNYVYEPVTYDELDELQRILREIWRCLQPGGVWIVVSCHGSRSAETVATLDHSNSSRRNSDEDSSGRLRKPWWQWRGVREYIERHYDLVKSYGAGIPLIQHGKRVKPFVVMVYKRKEASSQQRLARLYRNQREDARSEREFALVTQWHLEKCRWHAEEELAVRESRQMVVEDAMARSSESELQYQSAMRAREAAKVGIYRAMLAADRASMAAEDTLAAAVRADAFALVVFIRMVVFDIADSVVAVALVNESRRAATVTVVVEKNPVPDETAGANTVANSHQVAMETVASPADPDGACGDGPTQSAEHPKSRIPSDSLVANCSALIAAEVPGEDAIVIPENESSSEEQHTAAQVAVVPATLERRPVADIVEQVSAANDGEALKDDATGDAAQCAEQVKESKLPFDAGDSRETSRVLTGEDGHLGSANQTFIGAGDKSDKQEATWSASTVVAKDQPAMMLKAQPDTTQHPRSNRSKADASAENGASGSQAPVDPVHAGGGGNDGQESGGEVLSPRDAAATINQQAVAPTKAATDYYKPSHDNEQVDEPGFSPDVERLGNGLTTLAPISGDSASLSGAHPTGNASTSASVNVVCESAIPNAPKDPISAKTEIASGALDGGVAPPEQEYCDANVADESLADPGSEKLMEPDDGDRCAPPASLSPSGDDAVEDEGVIIGNSTDARRLGATQGELHAVKPQQKFEPGDEKNKSVGEHPTGAQILPLQATELLPVSAAERDDGGSIRNACLEALGQILDSICRDTV